MNERMSSGSVNNEQGGRAPGSLGYVRRFQDLRVYRKARMLAKAVFEASKTFPREEAYSLTDQGRRASRSIGAQIAEAWAKRRYARHFASKLTDADGEQLETQHWLIMAFDCGYLSEGIRRPVQPQPRCLLR